MLVEISKSLEPKNQINSENLIQEKAKLSKVDHQEADGSLVDAKKKRRRKKAGTEIVNGQIVKKQKKLPTKIVF
jgi:hypothetical protein